MQSRSKYQNSPNPKIVQQENKPKPKALKIKQNPKLKLEVIEKSH